jgi:putative peptidoglycan lipid II flippase
MSNASNPPPPVPSVRPRGSASLLVAAGIFLSRIAGLVRQRVFAHYFGNSAAADAFNAAFKIPNFLQNLFGEGVLSASFIPVYSRLLAHGDEKEAGRLAGAIASCLALLVSVLVLGGVLATPWLVDAIAPGFTGEKRALTVQLVQILFPGAGLLVLSAWCLGILNSHRKFFLSYTAPVIWNVIMIGTLIAFGGSMKEFPLAIVLAWGSVVGSAAQFLIQLPMVLKLARNLQFAPSFKSAAVRTVAGNFVPVFFSRGVVQISAYVDSFIASWLPTGAVAALAYGQTLYTLPVSLFGMAISAAELPEMSSAIGTPKEVSAQLRKRLDNALRRIAFFIVPSAIGFLTLGDVIVGALFQTGRFNAADARYVWAILAGSALGLLATTAARLYSSAFYALHDTRTPVRFAVIRVFLSTSLGCFAALKLPELLGIEARWGVAGLTIAGSIAGWTEFTLLRRALNARIGKTGVTTALVVKLWIAAALSAGAGWGVKLLLPAHTPPVPAAIAILGVFGACYFAATMLLRVPEASSLLVRFMRRR